MRFCTHGHFALYLRLQTRLMCVRIARKGEEICSRSGALRQVPAAECIWETSFRRMLAWLSIRSCGGRLVLRIEDLDPDRCRPAYADTLKRDLEWLGLDVGYGADPAEPTLGGLPGDVFPAGGAGAHLPVLLLAHRASRRVRAPCVRRNRALRRDMPEFNAFRARGEDESPVLARPCAGRGRFFYGRRAGRIHAEFSAWLRGFYPSSGRRCVRLSAGGCDR